MSTPRVDESGILSQVRLTYEAVEAPDGWDHLLAALARSVDAHVFLEVLLPHLQQAIRLTRRLTEVHALANLSRSVLDRMPIGILLLDSSGRVAVMNRAAEEILALKDGLTVTPCGLKAASRREDEALAVLVRRATSTAKGNGICPGGILPVPRPSLRRDFLVEVVPYGLHSAPGEGGCVAVAVFVSDPEAVMTPSHLGCAYGLTPAEEALTVHLAHGETLESAAEALEISLNTARTHLKHIFAKTGVKRQSDLVRLVVTGITGLRPP